MIDSDRETRIETLHQLRRKLHEPRERSPVEAHEQLTDAYVDFTFAYGYARLGNAGFARKQLALARKKLAAVDTDAIHAQLIAAYEARVAQALAGQRRETPLPEAIRLARTNLGRVQLYKVDRLRESARVLTPVEEVDAIGAFSHRLADHRGAEVAAAMALADPTAAVMTLVSNLPANDLERGLWLRGVLELVYRIPVADAKRILIAASTATTALPVNLRAPLHGKLLVAADYFGLDDVATTARARILRDGPGGDDLREPLFEALRLARRARDNQQVTRLLAVFDEPTRDKLSARVVWAAAKGDHAILDRAHAALADPATLTLQLDLSRSLSMAYQLAPLAVARTGVLRLAERWPAITDSFGTNSHFCLSAIAFADLLVLAIL